MLRVPGTGFGLAVSVDCNARLVALDPYEGGKAAVAEAARNVACTGAGRSASPTASTSATRRSRRCSSSSARPCRGIADACRAFGTPVTGGNVSFYNESPTGAIDPTPTIGMVGLLERRGNGSRSFFGRAGDDVLILGADRGELGGSAYWAEIHGFVGGAAAEGGPRRRAAAAGLPGGGRGPGPAPVRPRLLEGGLLVALAEAAMGGPYAAGPIGAKLDLEGYAPGARARRAALRGRRRRVVASADPAHSDVAGGAGPAAPRAGLRGRAAR